jgi:hypothetical protein
MSRHWWERFLFNQNTHRIRAALAGRRDMLVADVPYRALEPEERGSAGGFPS